MINYTDRITALMRDIVQRVPALSAIELDEVLVFARYGRSGAEGAYATCHCLALPPSEPGYFYWCDRRTGRMTRRSEWFVMRSPVVTLHGRSIRYLISFVLPRFCGQTLACMRKRRFYPGAPPWVAKLDTVVHELFHIDPDRRGLRKIERTDGRVAVAPHTARFFAQVAEMVREYLASDPDPADYEFLRHDFATLEERWGPVVGTTFRTFPSFPQRYRESLAEQPAASAGLPVEPIRRSHRPTCYTERDLEVRQFFEPSPDTLQPHAALTRPLPVSVSGCGLARESAALQPAGWSSTAR